MNYIILSEKVWNKNIHLDLQAEVGGNWYLISNKADFNSDNLKRIAPQIIFIPHWSYFIPGEIYNKYKCIVFHMTDLPYGRGGSPLQNLIVRGHKETMISAIKVVEELDAGDIYLKKALSLSGSAREIFIRATFVVMEMIKEIIRNNPQPKPQTGNPVYFKRRKPEQSNISTINTIQSLYDHIRMLDAEGYPKAYLENDHFRFEFSESHITNDEIIAKVKIVTKKIYEFL